MIKQELSPAHRLTKTTVSRVEEGYPEVPGAMGAAFWQASPLSTQGSKPSPGLRTKQDNTQKNNLFKPDKTQQSLFKRNEHLSNSSSPLGAKYQTYKREELDNGTSCTSEIKTNQEIARSSFCLRGLKTISTIRSGCATISEQVAEGPPTPSRSTSRRQFLVRSLLQLVAAVVVGHLMQFEEVAGKFLFYFINQFIKVQLY